MPRSRPKLLLLTVPGKCLVWTGSAQGRRTDLVPNVLELAGFISGLRCEHMRTTFATQVLDVSWHIELYIDIWICLIMCFFCICFQPWGGLGAQVSCSHFVEPWAPSLLIQSDYCWWQHHKHHVSGGICISRHKWLIGWCDSAKLGVEAYSQRAWRSSHPQVIILINLHHNRRTADFRLERRSAKEGQDKDLETQPSRIQTVGQIAASLGVSNLGAPNNKKPQTFSFRVGPDLADDDDVLHTAWNMVPPPPIDQLPGLHPTSLRSMQLLTPRSTRLRDKVTDHWHIYTDGSAGRNCDETEGNLSSWACVIYTAKKPMVSVEDVHYVDWIGGITETDPLAADWTGATEHSSRHAEATALVWGMLYYLQLGTHAPLHLHCDPLVILKAVKGEWQFDLTDTTILRARATFLLLWTFLKSDLTLEHVKGHSGHFGNELSDVIAGAIRAGILEPRVPKVNLACWYHGTNPAICWAWTQIDAEARQGQVMSCQEGWLQWQPVDEPDITLGWTTWRQQTTDTLQTYELALSVATYNVGTRQ